MQNYKPSSIIQETALTYLVHNSYDRKDIADATKLFNQCDKNLDGKVKKLELKSFLQEKNVRE